MGLQYMNFGGIQVHNIGDNFFKKSKKQQIQSCVGFLNFIRMFTVLSNPKVRASCLKNDSYQYFTQAIKCDLALLPYLQILLQK